MLHNGLNRTMLSKRCVNKTCSSHG